MVPEEEMAARTKKISDDKDIKTIHKTKDTGTKDIEHKDIKKDIPSIPKSKSMVGVGPNIVKRIYFPGDKYSKNQKGFKKILSTYGLSWYKPMMKSYPRKDDTAILTGMYVSADKNRKIFCIYEGTNRPMTAIVKIIGSGGNFLIELNSYCHSVGCTIEDKDDTYVNNTMLSLQESGELYVEKKMEDKTLEGLQVVYEEKVQKRLDEAVEKFIEAHRFVYDTYCEFLFWKRGVSEGFIRKFRRMEIEQGVRWSVEHGL